MTGAEVLLRSLLSHGVTTVFGVPGDTSMAWYDALHGARDRLIHVMARDERSAGFMADAYSRVTGRPGVVEGPSGAGATYLLPAVSEANDSSLPLVAINSDIRQSSDHTSALTRLDQEALFRPVTKWNLRLMDPSRISDLSARAFREATSGRPGAVHLAVPENLLADPAPEQRALGRPSAIPYTRTRPHSEDVERAAALLAKAERPVILAGGGVLSSGAEAKLLAVAALVGAPVVTSISGKGAIPDSHSLSLGVVGGNGGKSSSNQAVREADLILAIGTRMNSVTTDGGRLLRGGQEVIWSDIDPSRPGRTYPDAHPLVGDALSCLSDLEEALKEWWNDPPKRSWADRARERVLKEWEEISRSAHRRSGEGSLSPSLVVEALSCVLPPEAVLVGDAGTPTPQVSALYPVRRAGRRFLFPRAHGGLGYALPAALGAHLGDPEQTVVSLFGDGSLMMSLGELETVARLRAPVVLMNLRNDCFGWIKALQHLYYGDRYFSVDFEPCDYISVARGLGIKHARSVRDPQSLQQDFSWAVKLGEPVFLDVHVTSPEEELPQVTRWKEDALLSPEKRRRASY